MTWEKINDYPYSHSTSQHLKLYRQFVKRFCLTHYKRSPHTNDFKQFIEGDRYYNSGKFTYDTVPEVDHAMAFRINESRKILYVYHPYQFDKQILKEWCDEREIKAIIYNAECSFYNPGNTYMILLMSENTYNYLIEENILDKKKADNPS